MPRKVLLTAEGVVVHPPPAIAQTSQPLESVARRRSLPNHHEIKKSMQAIIHEQATQVVEAGAVLKQLKHGGGNHSTTEDKTEQKPKAKRQTRTWESRFEDLLEFKMNHGHVNVPKKWKEDPGLYWWVCSQRNKYKYLMDGHTNNLTVDQIDRLNSIGFQWNAKCCKSKINQDGAAIAAAPHNPARAKEAPANATNKNPKVKGITKVAASKSNDEQSVQSTRVGNAVVALKQLRNGHPTKPIEGEPCDRTTAFNKNANQELLVASKKRPRSDCENTSPATEDKESGVTQSELVTDAINELRKKGRSMNEASLAAAVLKRVEEQEAKDDDGKCFIIKKSQHADKPHDTSKVTAKLKWESKFAELLEYKKKFGTPNVTKRLKESGQLYYWLTKQRRMYQALLDGKKTVPSGGAVTLTEEQIKRLNEVGLSWGIENNKMHSTTTDIPSEVLTTLSVIADEAHHVNVVKANKHWSGMYKKLKAYEQKHGHCDIRKTFPLDRLLYSWIINQRNQKSELSDEQIKLLDEINFVWVHKPNQQVRMSTMKNIFEEQWNDFYEQLKAYKEEYGNCDVPMKSETHPQLAAWVGKQRRDYKDSNLTVRQIKDMEDLDFAWCPRAQQWNNGHSNVPDKTGSLGKWCSLQRARFLGTDDKKSALTPEQIGLLNDLAFVWEPYKEKWNAKYQQLKEFKVQNGHCNVPPQAASQFPGLKVWVEKQRKRKRAKAISQEQIDLLDEIGFNWESTKAQWNDMFKKLQEYKEKNGGCQYYDVCSANPILGRWMKRQRNERSKLSEERKNLLTQIGFDFNAPKKSPASLPFQAGKVSSPAQEGNNLSPSKYSPHDLLQMCQREIRAVREENQSLLKDKKRMLEQCKRLHARNQRQAAEIDDKEMEIKRLKKALRIMTKNA